MKRCWGRFNRLFGIAVIALMAGAPSWVFADLSTPSVIDVEVKAWARATPPGGSTGAIYGAFINNGQTPATVASLAFDGAHHVMIHRTVNEDGMMKMKHAKVVVPAGESVVLEPGGLHVMLMGLQTGLQQGCEYHFSITWDDGSVSTHDFVTGSFGQSSAPMEPGRTCP